MFKKTCSDTQFFILNRTGLDLINLYNIVAAAIITNLKKKEVIKMTCRKARMAMERAQMTEVVQSEKTVMKEGQPIERLWFGVDSNVRADNILQNNLVIA